MLRKNQRLAAIGLLLIAGGNIIFRYFEIPDFSKGIVFGIGLGLMLLALYRMKRHTAS